MSFIDFEKHNKPKKGFAIRITAHMLGVAGMALATWLGERREKKEKEAIEKAKKKALK